MNLSEIFTIKNVEILKLLFKENLHIRDIANRLKISPAKVHNSIKVFNKYGLISETKDKNKIIISLNKNNKLLKNIENIIIGKKELVDSEETINIFDTISPLDFRYYGRNIKIKNKLKPYLSESAFIKNLAKVETALVNVLAKNNICSKEIALEVERASKQITAEEVYKEEDKIKHNIRALVNSIRNKVSNKAKPYVHFTATSFDIFNTAEALKFKNFTNDVLIPELKKLESTLIKLALREKSTLQMGRTHGQHAVPITFGFAIAQFVSRLGNSIFKIKKSANDLRGKFSGAVGAYNTSSLFFEDPEKFERQIMEELKLKASSISTQVVEAEYIVSYVNTIIEAFGILANIADDMRHLQRSEIAEIGELFEKKQVGSSTMPQKRNPINFENVKSMWKEFMPRIITLYQDQISEHQRDLTNSASSRFIPEILAGFYVSVNRLNKVMSNLALDKNNLRKNFDMNKGLIVAEPLYILLASYGHPNAHECVRELTLKASSKKSLQELIKSDKSLKKYLNKFTNKQLSIINNPENYVGIASKKTESVCLFWKKKLRI